MSKDLERIMEINNWYEILDFWLGDASNKQARINLFYECKYNAKIKKEVLNYWKDHHNV